jgi:8-oxo-dGTP pyrophosphatase MutT (NUDIX family)
MEQKRYVYCANCGERGHVYRECTGPITSFGIIAFKVVNNPQEEEFDLNDSLKEILKNTKIQKKFEIAGTNISASTNARQNYDHRGNQMLFQQFSPGNWQEPYYDHLPTPMSDEIMYWNYWTIDKGVNWSWNDNTTDNSLLNWAPSNPKSDHRNFTDSVEHQHTRPGSGTLLNWVSNGDNYPKIKFLLIQRKDTMGYIDFIRGKYPETQPEKIETLKTFLKEMTILERESLLTKSFDQIWDEIWNNKESKIYKNEYANAKEKFEKLNVHELVSNTKSDWVVAEFGLPKGRRCLKESNLTCAEREFFEETGYSKDHYTFLMNYPPVIEEFNGTNGIRYRHLYYIVKMNDSIPPPKVDSSSLIQTGEVSNVGWFTNDECQMLFRHYDTEKKKVLDRVNRDLMSMNYQFNCSSYFFKKNKFQKNR